VTANGQASVYAMPLTEKLLAKASKWTPVNSTG